MLKILQAKLQQYMNQELPYGQTGFRKGTGDQIASIHWIIEKAREFQKNTSALLTKAKAFDCVDHNKLWEILQGSITGPQNIKHVCHALSFSIFLRQW